LVNEVVGRILDPAQRFAFNDTDHFLATAGLLMKRLLIDRARHKQTQRAGGQRQRQELSADQAGPAFPALDALILKEHLQRLDKEDPLALRIVQMRCQGHAIDEIAKALAMSRSSAYALWSFARAWLVKEMRDADAGKV
jgi:DNA-directed RNA polymerase specialized sigma24 family protein